MDIRQEKVAKFWIKNGGGHICNIGNGIYLLTSLPLNFLGIAVDSSKIHVMSVGDERKIAGLHCTIMDNLALPDYLQAVLIGNELYKVIGMTCLDTGMSPAGYCGLYEVILKEIMPYKKKGWS